MTSQTSRTDRYPERLQQACREHGVSVTHQRRVVYEAIVRRRDHPSADAMYEEVRRTVPDISRATVYRVLELLVDFGLVDRISQPAAVCRYDGRTKHHHHLVCMQCHQLIDLDRPKLDLKLPDTRRLGFKVTGFSVLFHGICQTCRRSRSEGSRIPNNIQ